RATASAVWRGRRNGRCPAHTLIFSSLFPASGYSRSSEARAARLSLQNVSGQAAECERPGGPRAARRRKPGRRHSPAGGTPAGGWPPSLPDLRGIPTHAPAGSPAPAQGVLARGHHEGSAMLCPPVNPLGDVVQQSWGHWRTRGASQSPEPAALATWLLASAT